MTTKRIDKKESNIFSNALPEIENNVKRNNKLNKSVTFLMSHDDFKALCNYFNHLKLKQGEGIRFALGYFLRNYETKKQ